MADWTGNSALIQGCNNRNVDGEKHDYYATDPIAMTMLLEKEDFYSYVWECAVGGGHLAEVLKEHGYKIKCSDIIDRGYPNTKIIDFLTYLPEHKNNYDIITNPPYKYALEFVEHALDISMDSVKVAMFLKLTFLSSQKRKSLFLKRPPKKVYVFTNRIECGKNGKFEGKTGVDYAWFIWEKGYKGPTILEWL